MAAKIEYPIIGWLTLKIDEICYPRSWAGRSNALPLRAMRTGAQSGTTVFILYLGWLNNPKCWYLVYIWYIFGIYLVYIWYMSYSKIVLGDANAHAIRPYLSNIGADWCWLLLIGSAGSKMIQVGLPGLVNYRNWWERSTIFHGITHYFYGHFQ